MVKVSFIGFLYILCPSDRLTKSFYNIFTHRQMANANDLRTCQQCEADVELEKAKFERKQRKLFAVSVHEFDGFV